jgi:uncharacterized membrane protein (DUF2068 family)
MEETVGAKGHADPRKHPERSAGASPRKDRLLPWIAAERAFRAVVLISVGILLLSKPNANWAAEITHLAQRAGLNPNGNWPRKIIEKIHKINANEDVVFGVIALAYGTLEGVEAYGLWKRRRWGEWLTVIATSLLLAPEVWELTKSVTLLKIGALIVNLVVVAYLLWRLRD